MSIVAIKRMTLADQVLNRVIEAIVVGDIASGSPISEIEIAERFGVSRGPAREAIFRLEAKGMVTRTAHLGARVVSLTLEDLQALFEMRESIEGMACRLAAERMTTGELDFLGACLDRHAAQPEVVQGRRYLQPAGDHDFHVAIMRASHNPRLERALYGDIYDVLRLYRVRSSTTPGRSQQALEEHRLILRALQRRDAEEAEQMMRNHIKISWANTRLSFENDSQTQNGQ